MVEQGHFVGFVSTTTAAAAAIIATVSYYPILAVTTSARAAALGPDLARANSDSFHQSCCYYWDPSLRRLRRPFLAYHASSSFLILTLSFRCSTALSHRESYTRKVHDA